MLFNKILNIFVINKFILGKGLLIAQRRLNIDNRLIALGFHYGKDEDVWGDFVKQSIKKEERNNEKRKIWEKKNEKSFNNKYFNPIYFFLMF